MFTLLKNADIYAPKPLGLGQILVCAGKIVAISKTSDRAPPELGTGLEIQTLDLEGSVVLPGLIDAHTHVTGGGGETGYASRVPTVPLSDFTRAGVTSVVGLLGTDDVMRSTSSLIAATMALREQGLSAWCYTGGYHFPLTLLTESAISDIAHIECVIGIGELAISDHRSSHLTCEELIRVAGQAHVGGLMTGKAGVLHLHMGDGSTGLSLVNAALDAGEVPARTYNPTHVNRKTALFDEACELTLRGCNIDLTAYPVVEKDPDISVVDAVLKFIDGGYDKDKLTVSSDGGGCLPVFDAQGTLTKLDFASSQSLITALGELLHAGLALEDAAPFFSQNVAKLLRLHNKGEIRVGADADLISLDSNHAVCDVMCRGEWHVRGGRVINKGMFE